MLSDGLVSFGIVLWQFFESFSKYLSLLPSEIKEWETNNFGWEQVFRLFPDTFLTWIFRLFSDMEWANSSPHQCFCFEEQQNIFYYCFKEKWLECNFYFGCVYHTIFLIFSGTLSNLYQGGAILIPIKVIGMWKGRTFTSSTYTDGLKHFNLI